MLLKTSIQIVLVILKRHISKLRQLLSLFEAVSRLSDSYKSLIDLQNEEQILKEIEQNFPFV